MNTATNLLIRGYNEAALTVHNSWMFCYKFMLKSLGSSDEVLKYGLLLWASVVILGVVLGTKRKMAVYNSYEDVSSVFIALVAPIVMGLLVMFVGVNPKTTVFKTCKAIAVLIEVLYIVGLFVATARRNRSIWKTLVAFTTKITLASLLVFNIALIFMGGRKRELNPKLPAPVIDTGLAQLLLSAGLLSVLIISLVYDEGTESSNRLNVQFKEYEDMIAKAKKERAAA